jgi:hypothetical protein
VQAEKKQYTEKINTIMQKQQSMADGQGANAQG